MCERRRDSCIVSQFLIRSARADKKGRREPALIGSEHRLLRGVVSLRALDVALLDPRHECAEALTGLLDWVVFALLK